MGKGKMKRNVDNKYIRILVTHTAIVQSICSASAPPTSRVRCVRPPNNHWSCSAVWWHRRSRISLTTKGQKIIACFSVKPREIERLLWSQNRTRFIVPIEVGIVWARHATACRRAWTRENRKVNATFDASPWAVHGRSGICEVNTPMPHLVSKSVVQSV